MPPGLGQMTMQQYERVGANLLLAIRQLTLFAVPAFLFSSGFFVAFAARGNRSTFTWKMVRTRLVDLLIPYFVWSVTWFIVDAIQGHVYAPLVYIERLVNGSADGGSYYFIPLLCQFYLLTPFILPLAKTRPALLVVTAGLIQLISFAVNYFTAFKLAVPGLAAVAWLSTAWLIPLWACYFPLGMVFGLHSERIKRTLARHYRLMLIALALMALATIAEPEVIRRLTGIDFRANDYVLSPAIYAVLFITVFVAFDQIKIWRADLVSSLSTKTYGIYLLHAKDSTVRLASSFRIFPWYLDTASAAGFPNHDLRWLSRATHSYESLYQAASAPNLPVRIWLGGFMEEFQLEGGRLFSIVQRTGSACRQRNGGVGLTIGFRAAPLRQVTTRKY